MHEIWSIPELVERVCRQSFDENDLKSLALSCRAICSQAEIVLWENPDGLERLLNLLPDDAVNLKKIAYRHTLITVLRPLNDIDWERALYHGSHARWLSTKDILESTDALQNVLMSCPSPLFPNLRILHTNHYTFHIDSRCWSHFLTPSLMSVCLMYDGPGYCSLEHSRFLECLTLTCRSLDKISINAVSTTSAYRTYHTSHLFNNLHRLPHLRKLKIITLDDNDWRFMDHIAAHDSLESLSVKNISQERNLVLPDRNSFTNRTTFRSLKTLKIRSYLPFATGLLQLSKLSVNRLEVSVATVMDYNTKVYTLAELGEFLQALAASVSVADLKELRLMLRNETSCGIVFKTNVSSYVTRFYNLRVVHLSFHLEDFQVTDQDIADMAKAWPYLQTIALRSISFPSAAIIRQQSENAIFPSLDSLRLFREHCPDIKQISMPLDASHIAIGTDLLSYPAPCNLVTISIPSWSPISNAATSAKTLLQLFPNLEALTDEYGQAHDHRIDLGRYQSLWKEAGKLVEAAFRERCKMNASKSREARIA